MATQKPLSQTLKNQFEKVSTRMMELEKRAEKEIRSVIKKTDQTRRTQMKRVNELLSEAQKFGSSGVLEKAGKLQKDLEKMAGQRMQVLLNKLHLPSKQEIDRLQSKINSLEKRLQQAESKPSNRRARRTAKATPKTS